MIPKEKISVQNLINEERNFCIEESKATKQDLSSWHSGNSHSLAAHLQKAKLTEIRKNKLRNKAKIFEKKEKFYALTDSYIEDNAKYLEIPMHNQYLADNSIQKKNIREDPKNQRCNEPAPIIDFDTSVLQSNNEFSRKLRLPKLNFSNNSPRFRSNSLSFQRNSTELSHFDKKVPKNDCESRNKLCASSIYPPNFYDRFFVEPSLKNALETRKFIIHKSTIVNPRLKDESSLRTDIKEFIKNIRVTIAKSKF